MFECVRYTIPPVNTAHQTCNLTTFDAIYPVSIHTILANEDSLNTEPWYLNVVIVTLAIA